jgi:hypothetical protein
MGVTRMQGTAGWTTDPPAAILYAVEPEGLYMNSSCEYKWKKKLVRGGLKNYKKTINDFYLPTMIH